MRAGFIVVAGAVELTASFSMIESGKVLFMYIYSLLCDLMMHKPFSLPSSSRHAFVELDNFTFVYFVSMHLNCRWFCPVTVFASLILH
jgi:hypothetical protein